MKTSAKVLVLGLVALLVGGFASASTARSDEVNDAKAVNSMVEKVSPAATEGEKAEEVVCGIGLECHVDSRVNAYIRVYINGVYRGTMAPYGDIYPFVGDPRGSVTTLYAVSSDGRLTWSRNVYDDVSDFHWVLYP